MSLVPNEDPTPGHSPPSPHQQGWTIYKRSGIWDDVIEGPDTTGLGERGNREGVEVVPAAAADRLAEALEFIEGYCFPDHEHDRVIREKARSALSEYHSQKGDGRG